jgi:hypothetical protein
MNNSYCINWKRVDPFLGDDYLFGIQMSGCCFVKPVNNVKITSGNPVSQAILGLDEIVRGD